MSLHELLTERIRLGDRVRLLGGSIIPGASDSRDKASEAYRAAYAAWMDAERAYGLAMLRGTPQ